MIYVKYNSMLTADRELVLAAGPSLEKAPEKYYLGRNGYWHQARPAAPAEAATLQTLMHNFEGTVITEDAALALTM